MVSQQELLLLTLCLELLIVEHRSDSLIYIYLFLSLLFLFNFYEPLINLVL